MPLPAVVGLMRRLLVGVGLGAAVLHAALWGPPGLPAMPDSLVGALALGGAAVLWTAAGVAVYLASAVVHEALHAVAMGVLAGVPWREVHFGVQWTRGYAYVHADRPMTVHAYRGVLVLPGLVQGVLPIAAGLVLGLGWLTVYGVVLLASAAGDLAVIGALRGEAGGRLVRDHPAKLGCQLRVAATAGG